MPKESPTLYPEERIKKLIQELPQKEARIVALAYVTGSRVSELNKIVADDTFIDGNYLKIICRVLKKRGSLKGKVKRTALVRLDEEYLVKPLKELIEATPKDTPLVPLNRFKIYYLLKNATGLNPHMFRSIRATHLINKGYSAYQLKEYFKWSSITPGDYYVSLSGKDLEY